MKLNEIIKPPEWIYKVRDEVEKVLGRRLTDSETLLVGITLGCVNNMLAQQHKPETN